ncbi:MAG: ATP-binding protein [Erysipelotrichales bacterium]|nr:ATP-binding protein [Erysipelotrichales bacterium]
MENYVLRTTYLNKLKDFKEKKLIKVITGVRRCGKSVLMEQFQQELKKNGVKETQIISLNLEKLENEELLDYKKLHEYINNKLSVNNWTYVFLDEIQMVENFQRAVDSLQTKLKIDIYITGSNSHLLSGELATLLTGRYIQIHLLPLSFNEYVTAKKAIIERKEGDSYSQAYKQEFLDYLRFGAFPQLLELNSQNMRNNYLDSIYNTVVIKDILSRGKVQIGLLTSIAKYVFHNIGNEISSVNIANTLKANKRTVSYNTVERYLKCLKDSFIIYEALRYDIKGKQHFKSNSKYYVVDVGLRNMMLANKEIDIGHLLENVVYLELLRRDYKVNVGKVDLRKDNKLITKEVDFVAENERGIEYYQVAASILDAKTRERELESLNMINDHFPKYLITLDDYSINTTYNGIRVINAIDFFLGNY